jgi:hypothetical protein
MADVRDWGAFLRGRWNWTRGGYERGFPRGCQFTDVDAAVEFDGRSLMIEAKHYDGVGELPHPPSQGQRLYLLDEVRRGKTVLVVYGCGPCDDPQALYDVGSNRLHDWRGLTKPQRRILFKYQINYAMGIQQEPS